MITSLDYKSITLQALEVRPIAVTASVFSCLTSTGIFKVSFDGGPYLPWQGGIEVDNRPTLFTTIVLQNLSQNPITLTYYAGTCLVTYSPVTINVVSMDRPTYSKGSGILIAVMTTYPGADVANSNVPRKQITVTNLDVVNPLTVQDAKGNAFIQIPAGQAWTAETSAGFIVINPLALPFIVGETFYV